MAGPETSAPTPSRRSGPLLFRKKAGRRLETVGRLIERVRSNKDDRAPLNYIQALGLAADHRATEVIRPYYDKLSKAMEKEAALGIPDDIFWGPIPYFEFLCVAGDLFRIEGSRECEEVVRGYFDHPVEQVRWWAEHALEVNGPTTLKRNEEYARKKKANKLGDLGNST
jgi:hypothetical protein